MLYVVLAYVLSYLLGSIPVGLLIARARGVDLRAVGSGNIGATNAWRALGPALGTLVFALDVLKGLAGPLLGKSLVGSQAHGVIAICGALAIIGHTFPIFLGFKGGKGVATGLGVGLGLVPGPTLAAFAIWGVVLAIWRYISLASVVALTGALVLVVLFRAPWPYIVVAVVATLVVWIKHLPNMQRLRAGTEPKVGKKRPEAGAEPDETLGAGESPS